MIVCLLCHGLSQQRLHLPFATIARNVSEFKLNVLNCPISQVKKLNLASFQWFLIRRKCFASFGLGYEKPF